MFLNVLNKLGKSLVVLCALAFFFSGQVSFAQEVKEYGTRISDREAVSNLKGNRILELESKTKGFMLPRMSTEERDLNFNGRIGKEDSGLTIFNTDIACVEYYSGLSDKWVSVCGEAPPAIVDASDICADLVRHNSENLTAGVTVPVSEAITLTFRIARIGKVAINIVSDNGYDYTANETYMSEGVYKLRLQGKGIPTNSGVDNLKIYINEQLIDTCTIPVTVNPAQVDFTFQSSQVKTVQQEVNLYDDLTGLTGYAAEFDVNVISPGQGVVMATYNHTDGSTLVFRGEANFTTSGDAKIILRASGRLQTYQPSLTFNITSTNAKSGTSSLNGAQIIINTAKTKLKPICENLDQAVFGKYVQGSNLQDGDNKVVLNFEVLNSGLADLSLVSTIGGKSYEFIAVEKRFAFERGGLDKTIVTVTFKPTSALLQSSGVYNFHLQSRENDVLAGDACVIPITVEQPPVNYEIDCSTIKAFRPNVPAQEALDQEGSRVEMMANVSQVGKYSIVVKDPIGDVDYATREDAAFTATGLQKIVLYPVSAKGESEIKYSGDKTKSIVHTYTLNRGPSNNQGTCEFTIRSGIRNISIGVFGQLYEAALVANIANQKLFGPEGDVANVLKMSVSKVHAGDLSFTNYLQALKEFVDNNNFDILVHSGPARTGYYTFTVEQKTEIMAYIKSEFSDKGKGAIIYNMDAEDQNRGDAMAFMKAFDNANAKRFEIKVAEGKTIRIANADERGADHPILNPDYLSKPEYAYARMHGVISGFIERKFEFFVAEDIPASKFLTAGNDGTTVNALLPKEASTLAVFIVDNLIGTLPLPGGDYPLIGYRTGSKSVHPGMGYLINSIAYMIKNM